MPKPPTAKPQRRNRRLDETVGFAITSVSSKPLSTHGPLDPGGQEFVVSYAGGEPSRFGLYRRPAPGDPLGPPLFEHFRDFSNTHSPWYIYMLGAELAPGSYSIVMDGPGLASQPYPMECFQPPANLSAGYAAGAGGENCLVHISWDPVEGATFYQVMIGGDSQARLPYPYGSSPTSLDIAMPRTPVPPVVAVRAWNSDSVTIPSPSKRAPIIEATLQIQITLKPAMPLRGGQALFVEIDGHLPWDHKGWAPWIAPFVAPPAKLVPPGGLGWLSDLPVTMTYLFDHGPVPPGLYTVGLCALTNALGVTAGPMARADFRYLEAVSGLQAHMEDGAVQLSWQHVPDAESLLVWLIKAGAARGTPVQVPAPPLSASLIPGTYGPHSIEVQAIRSDGATVPGMLASVPLDIPVPPPANVRITPTTGNFPALGVVRALSVEWPLAEGTTHRVSLAGGGNLTATGSPALLPVFGIEPGPYQVSAVNTDGTLSSEPLHIGVCAPSLPEPQGLKGRWTKSEGLRFDCAWDPVDGADCYWLGFDGGTGLTQLCRTPEGSYSCSEGDDPPTAFWVQAVASEGIVVSPFARHSGIGRLSMPTGLTARWGSFSFNWRPAVGLDKQNPFGLMYLDWQPVVGAVGYLAQLKREGVTPDPPTPVQKPTTTLPAYWDGPVTLTVQAIPSDGAAFPSAIAECSFVIPAMPPAGVRIAAASVSDERGDQARAMSVRWDWRNGDELYAASIAVTGAPQVLSTQGVASPGATLPLPSDPRDESYYIMLTVQKQGRWGDGISIPIEARLPRPEGLYGQWSEVDGFMFHCFWERVPGADCYWLGYDLRGVSRVEVCREPIGGYVTRDGPAPSVFWVQAVSADGCAISPVATSTDIRPA